MKIHKKETPDLCFISSISTEFETESITHHICNLNAERYQFKDEKYCIFHLPKKDKIDKFLEAFYNKIESNNFDFRYVYFPSNIEFLEKYKMNNSNFSGAIFNGIVSFNSQIASRLVFEKAEFLDNFYLSIPEVNHEIVFDGAKFNNRVFVNSKFKHNVSFEDVIFKKYVYFTDCEFQKLACFSNSSFECTTSFGRSEFVGQAQFFNTKFYGEVSFATRKFKENVFFNSCKIYEKSKIKFNKSSFEKVISFVHAEIDGYLYFEGGESMELADNGQKKVLTKCFENEASRLEMAYATIGKPENVFFQSVKLRPSWFVKVDVSKFNFYDIDWGISKPLKKYISEELANIKKRRIALNKFQQYSITCRELIKNARESGNLFEASMFRQIVFETEYLYRKEETRKWLSEGVFCKDFVKIFMQKIKTLPWDIAHRAYRITSFYGEGWVRALIVFLLICPVFALLFYLFGSFKDNPLVTFGGYLAYSLQVMTLQRPEPKPDGFWTTLIYSLEIIFAPIQLALLALALRRKFMR